MAPAWRDAAEPVEVYTKQGRKVIKPTFAVELAMPEGADADRLRPYIDRAAALLGTIPAESGRKVKAALERFRTFMTLMKVEPEAVNESAVLAYIVYRVARMPKDPPLPNTKPFVEATTAAADVDCLARGLTSGDARWQFLEAAVRGPRIQRLLRQIGGRNKRRKTAKQPLLFTDVDKMVKRATQRCARPETAEPERRRAARDALAVAMLFFFALRRSELLRLKEDDINVIRVDGTEVIQLRIRIQKNGKGQLLDLHEPELIESAAKTLFRAFDLYNKEVGFVAEQALWRNERGSTAEPLGEKWLAKVVADAVPGAGLTTHSGRVGFATEAWAAGASLQAIMSVGRWRSLAALLYVIGDVDERVKTSKLIGTAGLTRDRLSMPKVRNARGAEEASSEDDE